MRGSADRLFVTTAGVGFIPAGRDLAGRNVAPGDVAIVNGPIGDHGAAILAARGELSLEAPVESDTAPLAALMEAVLAAAPDARAARDATRGGLAAVLCEIALAAGCGIEIGEEALPVRPAVRGLCEILGLDPLYLAGEGSLVVLVPEGRAEAALAAMRACPAGRQARVVGRAVAGRPGTVVMRTAFGGARIVDMPVGEQLPRIC